MYRRFLPSLFLVVLSVQAVFSQDPIFSSEYELAQASRNALAAENYETSTVSSEELTQFLLETSNMVSSLNSPENRISFKIKTANVMWNLDEKQGKILFQTAIDDVRQYVAQVDLETNGFQNTPEGNWASAVSSSELRTKTSRMFVLISLLTNLIADHDPESALQFAERIGQTFTNQELQKRAEQSYKSIEARLQKKIAAQDPVKALALGREKLAKGVSYNVINLMQTIYRKDAKAGAAFGAEILDKLKTTTPKSGQIWTTQRLLQIGAANFEQTSKTSAEKQTLFSEQNLRDLASIYAGQVLSSTKNYYSLSPKMLELLEKYAPQQAAQVRQFNEQKRAATGTSNPSVEKRIKGSGAGVAITSSRTARSKMNDAKRNYQREIIASVKDLSAENLAPEDKRKIIKATREKILAVNNKDFRLSNLAWLAGVSAKEGENELALKILNDAENIVSTQPISRSDFNDNWKLVNAYAVIAPEKSFSLIENMIYPLNGIVSSFVDFNRYAGNQRIIDNDEIVINNNVAKSLSYFSLSNDSIKRLAEADFDRLKNVFEKLNRPELRIETRLRIAKALVNSDDTSSFIRMEIINKS